MELKSLIVGSETTWNSSLNTNNNTELFSIEANSEKEVREELESSLAFLEGMCKRSRELIANGLDKVELERND